MNSEPLGGPVSESNGPASVDPKDRSWILMPEFRVDGLAHAFGRVDWLFWRVMDRNGLLPRPAVARRRAGRLRISAIFPEDPANFAGRCPRSGKIVLTFGTIICAGVRVGALRS